MLKTGMGPEKGVKPMDMGDLVFHGPPVEGTRVVHIDFLRSEPLHPIRKPESAIRGTQGAKCRSHPGINL